MPTAVNNVSGDGYGKMVAHVTRQYPNDNNKEHINSELTKYNETFHITNFEKQLSKHVSADYIKDHDAKALKRRHKKEMWHTKANYIADQKAKGLIQDKRMVAEIGDHVYFDEIQDRVKKLHPEWNEEEFNQHLFDTYNKAFKGFAKGFNQTHEHLVISRCDTNVDERPPHMHYQLTGMTETSKGKPSFTFSTALKETYKDENGKTFTGPGGDSKALSAFRADADDLLVQHFKRAMVADYGKSFNDIKLVRTGAESGLSQKQREAINNQVDEVTKARNDELDSREDKLNRREAKIKDREDFNWKLTRENNNLKHDTENAKKEIEDSKSKFALSMFNTVQDLQDTHFHAYDWVFDSEQDTQSLTPENALYEQMPEVQEAEPDELSPSEKRRKRAFNDVTELRGIMDSDKRKTGIKGVSLFSKITSWGKDKIDAVKIGFRAYNEQVEDRLNDEAEQNKADARENAETAKINAQKANDLEESRHGFKDALTSIFRRTGGVKRYFGGREEDFDKSVEGDEWPVYRLTGARDNAVKTNVPLEELVATNIDVYAKEVETASQQRLQQMIQEQSRQKQLEQQRKQHKKQKEDDGPDF